jgi:hypothetical protein
MYPRTKLAAEPRVPFAPRWQDTVERYVVRTCADYPDLIEPALELEAQTWESLGYLDYTPAHADYYDDLLERFPEYHLVLVDARTNDVVATGNCVPLRVNNDSPLPQEGWDWIVESAAAQRGDNANMVGALAISVPTENRAKGLARMMINAMRFAASSRGFAGVIAPVRPSAKTFHPTISIEDYLTWQDDRGRIFDPWLRSHVSAGGRMGNICHRSMRVEQPLEFWAPWLPEGTKNSGSYAIDGALVPLEIDATTNTGRYLEPNVWVTHGF